MEKRIKGQESFINVIGDGEVLEAQWRAVTDFDFADQLEVIDQGYIGETTNRKDSVYNGTSFNAKSHMNSDDEDKLRERLINKARVRDGAVGRIDITFTYSYPSGATRLITLRDVEFGEIGKTTGGRGEFVEFSWQGECSETTSSAAN